MNPSSISPNTLTPTSAESTELIKLATAMANAGSRLEYYFWENQLFILVEDLLRQEAETDLNEALDILFENDNYVYNELTDVIEACCETIKLEREGIKYDALLVAIPILAWSRFSIPAKEIDPITLADLSTQLSTHTLAKNTHLILTNRLLSPDQLPQNYVDTLRLTKALTHVAFEDKYLIMPGEDLPKTNHFLSDIRYLIGVVISEQGMPSFRWQEEDGNCETALNAWTKQGSPNLELLLPACSFQPLLLNSYHTACREASIKSRAYSIQASVFFLQAVTNIKTEELQCVVATFYGKELEEYRISFIQTGKAQVIHGLVWHLVGDENKNHNNTQSEIQRLLNKYGIISITFLNQHFPLEFCDDCQAPLFANLEGETVHAELPENEEGISPTLH